MLSASEIINKISNPLKQFQSPSNSIESIVKLATNTKWTLTSDFEVTLENKFIKYPMNINTEDQWSSTLAKSIVSINSPDLTAAEVDEVLGGERRIGVRMFEAFRFTIKFRDFDGGLFKRYFENIWVAQQSTYPDDVSTKILIHAQGKLVFGAENCLITSVSGINFDNGSAQIAEFDVVFISNSYSSQSVSEVGTNSWNASFDPTITNK